MVDLNASRKALSKALATVDGKKVAQCAEAMISALRKGRKILVAGNGGSAADAQHLVAELVCTFENRNRKPLRAIALTTNSSIMTAWSNDFSYDSAFERQVAALGEKGDVLVSITTSGNSKNVLMAMKKAKELGITNLLLSGKGGGEAAKLADISIIVGSSSTPRIQECHVFAIHEMCSIVDGVFSDEK